MHKKKIQFKKILSERGKIIKINQKNILSHIIACNDFMIIFLHDCA